MEKTKKDGRVNNGGARPGSGRKATEVTESTGFRVNKESLDYLRSIKYPLNAAINDYVKRIAKKMQKQEKKDWKCFADSKQSIIFDSTITLKQTVMKTFTYQGETLESLMGQLAYVNEALSYSKLENWERKEYDAVKKDLVFKIESINNRINESKN